MNFLIAGNLSPGGASASGLPESKQATTGLGGLFQLRSFLRTAVGTLPTGYVQERCLLSMTPAFSPAVTAVVEWNILVLPQPGLRANWLVMP